VATRDKEHGEGNYKATRDYNERTKRFVESGKADEAGRQSAPHDASEAKDMEDAERIGKIRAKEEDPALEHDKVAPVGGGRKGTTKRRG
jgi:hypothetical protein